MDNREALQVEYLPNIGMYRLFAPADPLQAIAYYDEQEAGIIAEDVLAHGYILEDLGNGDR